MTMGTVGSMGSENVCDHEHYVLHMQKCSQMRGDVQ